MKHKWPIAVVLVALMNVFASARVEEAPAWLRHAASLNVPSYGKDVPAVILLNEERRVVDEDGKVVVTTLYAVRILAREGRAAAVARAVYNNDSEKVKDLRAWMIRPSGEVKRYGKDQMADLALADNDIYNEARMRMISASDDADAGCIFGAETITEERGIFSQFGWSFQSMLPVLVSRLSVALPSGWRAESVTFNREKIEPVVSGTNYVWELLNLPPIEPEAAMPETTNIAARLAVGVYPPANKAANLRTFSTWKQVSRYLSELSDPQAGFNDAIAAKASELTVGAKSEFERIQALGRYAQGINYISIQIGTGRGGGYRPHAATDIFQRNYGDCKDKANLMRAMLKSLKIESYPVVIYSGDPSYVREEWPSPHQFNHCIIGVRVSDETPGASVIRHPTLGRLLIFDPTDDETPVGDLPDHEQGSWALLVAGDDGELMRMPVTPPEANRLERTVEAELTTEGGLVATVRERSFGQAAAAERRLFKRSSRPQYVKQIERWITAGAPSAQVGKIEPSDDAAGGKFALDVEFKSPGYGQVMRGRLMVFKPTLISRRSSVFLTAAQRKHPVVLESDAYQETVKIKLPDGFVVDEIPDAATLDQPFGSYSASYEVKDGHLIFKRALALKAATIPVEQYPAVRGFFERIRAVEQASVVLEKK